MTHPNFPADFKIRAATEADASLMAAVEAFEIHPRWSETRLHQELLQPTSRSWVILGEVPLAYLLMREVQSEWEIIYLLVKVDCRKEGLGRALMQTALVEIKGASGQSVFLEVRSHNLPAQFLYKSLGFEQCGERKPYYLNPEDDALIMRLDLPSGPGIGAKPE